MRHLPGAALRLRSGRAHDGPRLSHRRYRPHAWRSSSSAAISCRRSPCRRSGSPSTAPRTSRSAWVSIRPASKASANTSSGRAARSRPTSPKECSSGTAMATSAPAASPIARSYSGRATRRETQTKADERGMVATERAIRARAGRPYRVRQMSSLVPSIAHPHPADHAARLLSLAMAKGWDRMREDQRTAWEELWRAPDRDRRGRSAMAGHHRREPLLPAHLGPPASIASTSLFGLAYWPNYHYYRGHVMWDIETFSLLPPLFLPSPKRPARCSEYRHRHLSGRAASTRRSHGWNGAMYPVGELPDARRAR